MNMRRVLSVVRGCSIHGGWALSLILSGGLWAEELPVVVHPHPFNNREHTIYQMNGKTPPIPSQAELQWLSKSWPEGNAQMPYMVWMPERQELLMMVECLQPIRSAFIRSKDGGRTWSERTWLRNGDNQEKSLGLGLVYLGDGKLRAVWGDRQDVEWSSDDYGDRWVSHIEAVPKKDILYFWDQAYVLEEGTKDKPARLIESGHRSHGVYGQKGFYSQASVRFSNDGGQTWSPEKVVPQWKGVNEVTFVRAANGDLVAGCRVDYPEKLLGTNTELDSDGGLAVSISSDEGQTWTPIQYLYEWGRHHPCLVKMPNNDLLMTYIVRKGYTPNAGGYPRHGIEAVISRDNGKTWDLDHRIVLASYEGNLKGIPHRDWFCSVQSTSTVLLPDQTILTAFGTGFKNLQNTPVCQMDVVLIRWKWPENTLNNDRHLAEAAYDSELRNVHEPVLSPVNKE